MILEMKPVLKFEFVCRLTTSSANENKDTAEPAQPKRWKQRALSVLRLSFSSGYRDQERFSNCQPSTAEIQVLTFF